MSTQEYVASPVEECITIWASINSENSYIPMMSEGEYNEQIEFCTKLIDQCLTLGFKEAASETKSYKEKLEYYRGGLNGTH